MKEQATREPKWEYIRVLSGAGGGGYHEIIDRMAPDGWEFVGASPRTTVAQVMSSTPFSGTATKKLLYTSLAIAALLIVFFALFGSPDDTRNYLQIPISQLEADVKVGIVTRIVAYDNADYIDAYYGPTSKAVIKRATKEPQESIQKYLLDAGIPSDRLPVIEVKTASTLASKLGVIMFLLPTILVGMIFFLVMRQKPQAQQAGDVELLFRRPRR